VLNFSQIVRYMICPAENGPIQFNHYEGIEEAMEGGGCGIDEAM
jgi:hypothetical protein